MFSSYIKNDIKKKLESMSIYPLDVMITGVTGAGKSTTINVLFGETVATVGCGVDPETMDLTSYDLSDVARFWDTPGLGDGVEADRIHSKKIIDLLYRTYTRDNITHGFIDLALVVIEGSHRDLGTTNKLLCDVIIPNIQADRILVAINQADMAMKGRFWDKQRNEPEEPLKDFLENMSLRFQIRIQESTGVKINLPVYYSAAHNYNIEQLMDMVIDNIPTQRRQLVK